MVLRGVMRMLARQPVKRVPVHHGPVWLWDTELETYILVDELIQWTEGSFPTPIISPPERN